MLTHHRLNGLSFFGVTTAAEAYGKVEDRSLPEARCSSRLRLQHPSPGLAPFLQDRKASLAVYLVRIDETDPVAGLATGEVVGRERQEASQGSDGWTPQGAPWRIWTSRPARWRSPRVLLELRCAKSSGLLTCCQRQGRIKSGLLRGVGLCLLVEQVVVG